MIAVAQPADPLERPNVVPGGSPADFQERVSVAQASSRDMDRLERYKEQLRQERIERREERQAERAAARREAAAEAQEESTPVVASGSGTNNGSDYSGTLPDLLLSIRAHESGGNYSAYNAGGCEGYGCGGAFQLHLGYADDWAVRYGVGEWADTPPQNWPPSVQDTVALGLFYSTNPDGDVWCRWVEYC
jgi:hypothetical protein